jgi:hypothetical protein
MTSSVSRFGNPRLKRAIFGERQNTHQSTTKLHPDKKHSSEASDSEEAEAGDALDHPSGRTP